MKKRKRYYIIYLVCLLIGVAACISYQEYRMKMQLEGINKIITTSIQTKRHEISNYMAIIFFCISNRFVHAQACHNVYALYKMTHNRIACYNHDDYKDVKSKSEEEQLAMLKTIESCYEAWDDKINAFNDENLRGKSLILDISENLSD